MITANSRSLHHLDTRRLTARDLDAMQDQRRDADTLVLRDLHDSDLQHFDATPIPPPAVRSLPRRRAWPVRVWRRLAVAFCRWRIECIEDQVEDAGPHAGPRFLANCLCQTADYRRRIEQLEAL